MNSSLTIWLSWPPHAPAAQAWAAKVLDLAKRKNAVIR
jgi:hypothetical protein